MIQPHTSRFLLTLFILCLQPVAGLFAAERERPNFIVILADDVSPHVFGFHGSEEAITPNIDRMANEGVAFDSAWATPMCSPTRAMIMTGKYAGKTGWWHNGLKVGEDDFRKQSPEFAFRLKQEGYRTGLFGKWQLPGYPFDEISDYDVSVFWPATRGGNPGIHRRMNFTGLWENQNTPSRYWHPFLVKNNELLETNPDDFSEDILVDEIIEFMTDTVDQPFVAYYTMLLPHTTRTGYSTTPLEGSVGDLTNGTFQDNVNYIDVILGRLINAVMDSHSTRPTVIVFTGDNGMPWKALATERGARVPLVWWSDETDLVRPRGLTPAKGSLADIAPTLLDYAGIELDPEFDGISMRAFLQGCSDDHRDELYSYIGTARILRTSDFLWEVVDPLYNMPNGIVYRHFGQTNRDLYLPITEDNPYHDEIINELRERIGNYPQFYYKNPDHLDTLIRYDTRPGRHGPSSIIGPRGILPSLLENR